MYNYVQSRVNSSLTLRYKNLLIRWELHAHKSSCIPRFIISRLVFFFVANQKSSISSGVI